MAGDVNVDGKPALTDGWIDKSHVKLITINGQKLAPIPPKVYIIYNKPMGVDCNYSSTNKASLLGKINHQYRLFPVGRLDKDSHGLLLLTNDGEFCQQLMHPDYNHPKTYRVRVSDTLKPDFAELMSAGVEILDTCTKPCQVIQTHRDEFEIVLTQGLNRQIRRMCKKLGYHVTDLQRLSVLNLSLDRLEAGQWRDVTAEELDTLLMAMHPKEHPV